MEKLIAYSEVATRLGLGENTVRRMVDRGEFVQPLILSPCRVAFREDEVDQWLANRPRGKLAAPPCVRGK